MKPRKRGFCYFLSSSSTFQPTFLAMKSSKSIRHLLLEQLNGRNAHVDFEQAIDGLSFEEAGLPVEGLPHTVWQLIEHIRLGQDDIIEFCKNPAYEAIDWPDDYWPASDKPTDKEELAASIRAVKEGIQEMREMIQNPENDLQETFPHGNGQTLFREAMLIVDHNAYHIGQIVQIRRLLGSW